jgi:hypothetical protein
MRDGNMGDSIENVGVLVQRYREPVPCRPVNRTASSWRLRHKTWADFEPVLRAVASGLTYAQAGKENDVHEEVVGKWARAAKRGPS